MGRVHYSNLERSRVSVNFLQWVHNTRDDLMKELVDGIPRIGSSVAGVLDQLTRLVADYKNQSNDETRDDSSLDHSPGPQPGLTGS